MTLMTRTRLLTRMEILMRAIDAPAQFLVLPRLNHDSLAGITQWAGRYAGPYRCRPYAVSAANHWTTRDAHLGVTWEVVNTADYEPADGPLPALTRSR